MATSVHRPLLGRLAALLGCLGVVLCVVALVASWMVGYRINRATARAVGGLDNYLTGWVEAAVETQAGIELTRGVVRELEDRLQERIADALTPGPEVLAQITELEVRLQSGVQALHLWMDTADTVMAGAEQMLASVMEAGLLFQRRPKIYENLLSILRSGRDEIAQIDSWVAGLVEQAAAVHVDRERPADSPQISRLSDQIDGSLLNLDQYADGFISAIHEVTSTAERLRIRLRNCILLAELALSVFLTWQAVAQASLVDVGRRWYVERASSSP